MKCFVLAAAIALLPASLHAGDAIYFYQSGGLFDFSFDGRACGAVPLPSLRIQGDKNCAKVPTTYVSQKSDGSVTRERLESKRSTEGIDAVIVHFLCSLSLQSTAV